MASSHTTIARITDNANSRFTNTGRAVPEHEDPQTTVWTPLMARRVVRNLTEKAAITS
jgi:hypothetical protein